MLQMGFPVGVSGGFQGTAQVFQDALAGQGLLILAALFAIYVVLGILYESTIHPITILSGLPSAGLGALLTLMLFGMQLDVIAVIGIIMLIGIVKKNAIMMIDAAMVRRNEGESAEEAIYHACLIRFRPIMMTTLAATMGALPIALGHGAGAELRQPLGVAVVGGLMVSQLLTPIHHSGHLPLFGPLAWPGPFLESLAEAAPDHVRAQAGRIAINAVRPICTFCPARAAHAGAADRCVRLVHGELGFDGAIDGTALHRAIFR
jgi:hypothetical protein